VRKLGGQVAEDGSAEALEWVCVLFGMHMFVFVEIELFAAGLVPLNSFDVRVSYVGGH